MRIDWKPKGQSDGRGIDAGEWRCFEDDADWAGRDEEVVARLAPFRLMLPDGPWELRIIPGSPNSHGWLIAPGLTVDEFLRRIGGADVVSTDQAHSS